jgi:2-keto-4-pentenoate hydratase
MMPPFQAGKTAHYLFDAHRTRRPFENLPPDVAPATLAEAYDAQEAFAALQTPHEGDIAGLKIATTTRVMQELMRIDRPCAGMIFKRRVWASPARIKLASYMGPGIECEVALRVGRDLSAPSTPFTAETVRPCVSEWMPAFELIEDRKADYKQTGALSLIADNCWNAGVVLGQATPLAPEQTLRGIESILTVSSGRRFEGRSEDPLAALAWLANLAAERGRPLKAGMIVITGSVMPTLPPIRPGDGFRLEMKNCGSVELETE